MITDDDDYEAQIRRRIWAEVERSETRLRTEFEQRFSELERELTISYILTELLAARLNNLDNG